MNNYQNRTHMSQPGGYPGYMWGNGQIAQQYSQPMNYGMSVRNNSNQQSATGRFNNYGQNPMNQHNYQRSQMMPNQGSYQGQPQMNALGMNFNQGFTQRQAPPTGFSQGGFMPNGFGNNPQGLAQDATQGGFGGLPQTFPLGDPKTFSQNPNASFMPEQQPAPPAGPVNYEPLDEKTKAEVRKLIEKKQEEQGVPPEQRKLPDSLLPLPSEPIKPIMPMETPNESIGTGSINTHSIIEELIQGELNAFKFYSGLLGFARERSIKHMLREITENCEVRKDILSDLYNKMTRANFKGKNTKLIEASDLKNSIENAIDEETESLRRISHLYDTVENSEHLKDINSVIHRKFLDISVLNTISRRL